MFNNRSMIPQIEIPSAPPDFSQTYAPSVRDLVREREPKGRPTLLVRLGELPPSPARDELLSRFALICRDVEHFIFEAKADRVAELEHQRDLQRQVCRQAEDELKQVRIDLGRANTALAAHAAELGAARRAWTEAQRAPFDSRYPMPAESAAWDGKRAAARAVLNNEETRHQDLQQSILQLTYRFESAAKALNEADEVLRAIDRELASLRM
jgi:hypothetical protein